MSGTAPASEGNVSGALVCALVPTGLSGRETYSAHSLASGPSA
jgi:hypothetical protein